MKGLSWAAALLVSFATQALPAQTFVVTRNSNIREDPSTSHQPIGHVVAGDTLEKIEPQNIGGYGLVRSGEVEGWIWLRNVREVETPAPAPLDPAIIATGPHMPCPVEGGGTGEKQQASDRLKNRTTEPVSPDFDASDTLAKMLKKGNDENRFSEGMAAELIGYVEKVKAGDVETNNCHSPYSDDYDTHIELAAHPGDASTKRVIIEVTPRVRSLMAQQGFDWSTDALVTALTHKWIRVKGWLFFDYHHKGNATNTKPGGAHIWRATVWELHPVTAISVCSGGKSTC